MIGKIIQAAKAGFDVLKLLLKKDTLNPPLGKSKAQEVIDRAIEKAKTTEKSLDRRDHNGQ